MKSGSLIAVALLVTLVVSPGTAQESRYAGIESAETVTIVDAKGVVTEASGFGKLFGPPYLSGFRGESTVEIPFDRMRTLTAGEVIDNRLSVTLGLVSGGDLEVLLDRPEFETSYAGTADFGYFRIRLRDIKSLTFMRMHRDLPGAGQRCSKGHIWFNDTWRFCPYDGTRLEVIAESQAEK